MSQTRPGFKHTSRVFVAIMPIPRPGNLCAAIPLTVTPWVTIQVFRSSSTGIVIKLADHGVDRCCVWYHRLFEYCSRLLFSSRTKEWNTSTISRSWEDKLLMVLTGSARLAWQVSCQSHRVCYGYMYVVELSDIYVDFRYGGLFSDGCVFYWSTITRSTYHARNDSWRTFWGLSFYLLNSMNYLQEQKIESNNLYHE